MISIRINRADWLELYADTKLDITLSSPVFSDKVVEENSVYNFRVPKSKKNDQILDFAGRVQKKDRSSVTFDAEMFYSGKFFKRGSAIIRKTTGTEYELVIGVDASSFFAVSGKKYITDFQYGGKLTYNGNASGQPGSMYAVPNNIWPTVPFAYFPVYNSSLYDGSELETKYTQSGFDLQSLYGVIASNLVRPYQNDYMTMSFTPDMDTNLGNRMSVTPFPYVGTIIKGIFEESGYTITRNDILDDDNLCRLCIYNPNISPYYVSGLTTLFDVYLNEHLPKMLVSDFLLVFKQTFGMNFVINDAMKTVQIIVYKNFKNDRQPVEAMVVQDEISEKKLLKYQAKADGNDTFSADWIKPEEIEKHTNRGSYLTQAALSGISNPKKGDIALVQEENYFYLYDQDDTEAYVWSKFAYNIQNVTIGDADGDEQTIEPNFTGVMNDTKAMEYLSILPHDPDEWYVPVVEMPGNIRNASMIPTETYRDFELKLMMFYGWAVTDINGFPFPVGGSAVCKGMIDSLIQSDPLPALSLFPNHTYNYVDQYLTEFNTAFDNSRTRTIRRNMTLSQINEVDFTNTVLMDGRRWFITKVRFSLSMQGVSLVECEMIDVVE